GSLPSLSAGARAEAVMVLLARPERTAALLSALEGRVISPAELFSTQIRFLVTHPNAEIRERARSLFGKEHSPQRPAVVNQFQPALRMSGDGTRGQEVFTARCAYCHQLGGGGNTIGVDLTTSDRSNREKMLTKILEPGREVQPGQGNHLI